jgi:hypothetical protein
MAGESLDVVARIYHTENGVAHAEGEQYAVTDRGLAETLYGIGFVTPVGWTPEPPPSVATGATAGTPGAWTPPGATAPADLAAMSGVTASPATPWTTGQYMALGDLSQASWNGTGWVAGAAV